MGENYGKLICNGLINAYDDFFIENYYDKDVIPDFMQNIARSNVDYLDLASVIKKNFDDVIATLNDYAAAYPNYRSSRTGYSFAELAELYQNAENDLYAQLEGNIRAGNLARDPELVVKNYTTTVRSLLISEETYNEIAESYKTQIKTFYDSYKATGLYSQAAGTQVTQNSSNNRDQNVLRDYEHDFETLINTYDSIVLSYTQQAALASEARLDRTYYLNIIQALQTDQVAEDTKTRLVEKMRPCSRPCGRSGWSWWTTVPGTAAAPSATGTPQPVPAGCGRYTSPTAACPPPGMRGWPGALYCRRTRPGTMCCCWTRMISSGLISSPMRFLSVRKRTATASRWTGSGGPAAAFPRKPGTRGRCGF